MTVVMPAPSHFSKNGSKKSSTNRVAQNQHVLDARLALARIYQWQRLQREEALRSRPEPHQYTPRMDLYDDEASPDVAAMLELPGVDRDSLSLKIQGGKLVIHGERASPLSARLQQGRRALNLTPGKYKTRELKFGSFHREIDIPEGIDTSHIVAEMTDGMLLISWPRSPVPSMGRSAAPAV